MSTAKRLYTELGLKRTPATEARRRKQIQAAVNRWWRTATDEKKEIHSKQISDAQIKLVKKERLRIRWGLKQTTRLHLIGQTQAKRNARFRFRSWGYTEIERNTFKLPEDEKNRRKRSEELAEKKYNLRFVK